MNALIDTNVIVDVLIGDFVGWVCATTVTTVFYLVRHRIGSETTIERLKDLTSICRVAPVNQPVIDSAVHDRFPDFEDAVLHHSAILAGADCIVTRNEADFRNSSLLVYTPAQFLAALAQLKAE